MEKSAWSDALFEHLIERNADPDLPLFLYVDGEMLAEIGQFASADEALGDFKRAIQALSFNSAAKRASRWKLEGYPGRPPHLVELVAMVLSVTLGPVSEAEQGVYRRLRELLGLTRGVGAPEGYESGVSVLWGSFNGWLKSEQGLQYGMPTAQKIGKYTYQGYARSQSVIRASEKRYLWSFFGSLKRGDADGGKDLTDQLAAWLRNHARSSRLLETIEAGGLQPELKEALHANYRYWNQQLGRTPQYAQDNARGAVTTKRKRFEAVPVWTQDGNQFDLIVELSAAEAGSGRTIIDRSGEPYDLSVGYQFVYLTSAGESVTDWMSDGFDGWQLSEGWTVDWHPPQTSMWLLEEWHSGLWRRTQAPTKGRAYRLVVVDPQYEPPATMAESVRLEEASDGLRWVTTGGRRILTEGEVLPFVSAVEEVDEIQISLVGGLKIGRAAHYLCDGAPDVKLKGAFDMGTLQLRVDNVAHDIDSLLREDVGSYLRLNKLGLSPGTHEVVVSTGSRARKVTFITRDPEFSTLSDRPSPPARASSARRFRWLKTSEAYLITRRGEVWRLHVHPKSTHWIESLSRAAGLTIPRVIDFGEEPTGNRRSAVVYRSAPDKPWSVSDVQEAGPELFLRFRAAGESMSVETTPLSVLAVDGGAGPAFATDQDRERFEVFRDALSKSPGPRAHNFLMDTSESVPPRGDIEMSARDNPFDDFIYWLAEQPDGVSNRRASETLEWIYSEMEVPQRPLFEEVRRRLSTLGHLDLSEGWGRIRAAQSAVVPVSGVGGLNLLLGARSDDQLNELRSPSLGYGDEVDAALADLFVHEFVQVSGGQPVAPTTTYLELGGPDPRRQSSALGFAPGVERVRSVGREADVSRWQEIWAFSPSDGPVGGTWRERRGMEAEPQFLRGRLRHGGFEYAWYDGRSDAPEVTGWVTGLWRFHAHLQNEALRKSLEKLPTHDFQARRTTSEFERLWIPALFDRNQQVLLIREELPVPVQVEKLLVIRSGLLPRNVRTSVVVDEVGNVIRQLNGCRWRLFENVSEDARRGAAEQLGIRIETVDLKNVEAIK